jgi:hypothetical protein
LFLHPPNVKIPEVEKLAYLAGIIDGEGTIALHKSKPSAFEGRECKIEVSNTNDKLINWLLSNVGGKVYSQIKRQPNGYERKPLMTWELHGTVNVYFLLRAIKPYLIIKKEEAEKVMAFCERRVTDMYGKDALSLLAPETALKMLEHWCE